MKKYVVKPGESLYQISRKTGVRLPLILAANPQIQNANDIAPGMTIVIPELGKGTSAKPKAKKSQPKAKKEVAKPYFGYVWPHAVQPGETWTSIADRYNVTVEDLEHLNPALAARELTPGLVVYVPLGAQPEVPPAPAAPESVPGAWTAPPVAHVPEAHAYEMSGAPDVFLGGQGHQGYLQQPPNVMPDEGVEPWHGAGTEAPQDEAGEALDEGVQGEMVQSPEFDGGPHTHKPFREAAPFMPETDEDGWSRPFVIHVGNDG
ncbi:LysM peptidoglycan-binding domain-containing protein [Alicyclobacillus fructus]|uniref:LysM peptidoglycan-binding domain-containing protein n=1 Tax=Alicyclobacillus fructus TaxID=2816082 RepID=UPI001A8F6B9E|nr:LysM domain-containing protein [Alicyclobacillus fructus]